VYQPPPARRPGAWEGIDIHDLAKSSTAVVISELQWLHSRQLQAAGGQSLKRP